MRKGRARPQDTVLLVAFGGGLTWGSVVITLKSSWFGRRICVAGRVSPATSSAVWNRLPNPTGGAAEPEVHQVAAPPARFGLLGRVRFNPPRGPLGDDLNDDEFQVDGPLVGY